MSYHTKLPRVFVYLLNTVESLYQSSVSEEVKSRKNIHLAQPDCLIISCYLWGTLHFCETLKAKYQLATSLFPDFLEYSRFTRRCNALLPYLQRMRQALVFQEIQGINVSIIDSFPIPLCQPIRNLRSRVLGEAADIGYNATKSLYYYGCKCHALVSESGYLIDDVVTPASYADSRVAEEVLHLFPTPIVLGDKGYLGKAMQENLRLRGIQLITPVRKNMKQKPIPFPNFAKRRKVIERVFSFLANFGCERCKSRSIQGFQVKLEMTLLIYSIALREAKRLSPKTLRYSLAYPAIQKLIN